MSDSFQDGRLRKDQASPYTGSAPTDRHEEYHGPARRRGWVIPAIVVGLIAVFVLLLALDPGGSDDEPSGVSAVAVTRGV